MDIAKGLQIMMETGRSKEIAEATYKLMHLPKDQQPNILFHILRNLEVKRLARAKIKAFFDCNEVNLCDLLPTQQFKVSKTDFAVFFMYTENQDYLSLKDQGDFLKLAKNLSLIKEVTKLNCALYVVNFDEHSNLDMKNNILKEFGCTKQKKCNIRTYARTTEAKL